MGKSKAELIASVEAMANKVENKGKTEQGKLSAQEFNDIQALLLLLCEECATKTELINAIERLPYYTQTQINSFLENKANKTEVEEALAGKQATILDLDGIRSGAQAGATAYQKPSTGIPKSDMSSAVQTSLGKADGAYQKPSSGIPASDLAEGVIPDVSDLQGALTFDGEDIVLNSSTPKLADKAYSAANFSGLGRKYLRKNVVSNKNVLTQSMISAAHTIYHIQYDYDLNGAAITMPEDCTLLFDGGSLSNGTIIGNDTLIVANNYAIFKSLATKSATDITASLYAEGNANKNYTGVSLTANVGDTITMTKGDASTLDSIELTVSCGDVFRITGKGGASYQSNTWRLFTFVDSSNRITALSKTGFFGKGIMVAAPKDGKVYLQLALAGRPDPEDDDAVGYSVEKLTGYFTLQGSFRNNEFHPEWFGAVGDGVTDDADIIQHLLHTTQMLEKPTQMIVKLDKNYKLSHGLIVHECTTLKGNWVHTQNNPYQRKNDNTFICNFIDTNDWVIQSCNIKPKTGELLSLNKVLWRDVVDNGPFCYQDSVRVENVKIQGGLTEGIPIYGGIRISASNNSSLIDVGVYNCWVGVARGATWYSSDINLWSKSYYLSFVADSDMNNFSVYNSYLDTIASDIAITEDNKWSTDEIMARACVLTRYANGTFINPIIESAYNGMEFQHYSNIIVEKAWVEKISNAAFVAYTLCNVTLNNIKFGSDPTFMLQNARKSYKTTWTLIGTSLGALDCKDDDNIILYSVGDSVPMNAPSSGITLYRNGKYQHWNGQKFVNEEGFTFQNAFTGTYPNRPTNDNLKLGTIYMKTENNGNVRPIFESVAGTRAKGVFKLTTAQSTAGSITFAVGNVSATISVAFVAGETTAEQERRIANLLNDSIGNNLVFWDDTNGITIYNTIAETITAGDISVDVGSTGLEFSVDKTTLGTPSQWVGAMGDTASSDIVVSSLPTTAKNGDIVILTTLGKPVYYYNNKWRDFASGLSVEGGLELVSGNTTQSVTGASQDLTFTVYSKDASQESVVPIVTSSLIGVTSTVTLTDSETSLYTIVLTIPANADTQSREITFEFSQASSASTIDGTVTQAGISTDVSSFTELTSGSALYAPLDSETSARPYLNTGLKPKSGWKIEIKAKDTAAATRGVYNTVCGSGGWNSGTRMLAVVGSYKSTNAETSYIRAYYNNVAGISSVASDTSAHTYVLDDNKFYIDGTLAYTFDSATFEITDDRYKFLLYGIYIRSVQSYYDGSIYYAKVWDENNNLVLDLVPVVHNVAGFYAWKDKVSNTIMMSPNELPFELLT